MSRLRFGVLLAVLAVLVGGGAYLAALGAFDDDGPDTPPQSSGADGGADGGGTSETTASSSTVPVATEALASPAWVVVIASEGDEPGATDIAQQVAADGHPSGVLHSDDYPSMNAGFWVAFAGPYPDPAAAEAAVGEVEADGWTGAYARCAGSVEDCGRRGQGAGGGND
ncbi:MAG: SPOR domain-containing protein [Acidimicrobiales bacterium]